MNWKRIAEDDLKDYQKKKNSLKQVASKIDYYNTKLYDAKGISYTPTPIDGGGSKYEDDMLDSLIKKQRLEDKYKDTIEFVKWVDKGLNLLSERDRNIIYICYIEEHSSKSKRWIDYICSSYAVSKSKAYDLRDEVLRNFTLNMYGCIED